MASVILFFARPLRYCGHRRPLLQDACTTHCCYAARVVANLRVIHAAQVDTLLTTGKYEESVQALLERKDPLSDYQLRVDKSGTGWRCIVPASRLLPGSYSIDESGTLRFLEAGKESAVVLCPSPDEGVSGRGDR